MFWSKQKKVIVDQQLSRGIIVGDISAILREYGNAVLQILDDFYRQVGRVLELEPEERSDKIERLAVDAFSHIVRRGAMYSAVAKEHGKDIESSIDKISSIVGKWVNNVRKTKVVKESDWIDVQGQIRELTGADIVLEKKQVYKEAVNPDEDNPENPFRFSDKFLEYVIIRGKVSEDDLRRLEVDLIMKLGLDQVTKLVNEGIVHSLVTMLLSKGYSGYWFLVELKVRLTYEYI